MKKKERIWCAIKDNLYILIFLLILLFVTFFIFLKILPDSINQTYGPIPILFAGIIVLSIDIFLMIILYNRITISKKIIVNPFIVILIYMLLFGLSFLSIYLNINYSNNYPSDFLEVNGTFVNSKVLSTTNNNNTYALIYSYKVEGVTYSVCSDFATSSIPEIGEKGVIFYNPNNPEEAIVGKTDYSNSKLLLLFATIFTFIPIIALAILLFKNIVNKKVKSKSKSKE